MFEQRNCAHNSGPQQHLDRAPFVHRGVPLGDVGERDLRVEHLARVDLSGQYVGHQLWQVRTTRRGATVQPDVPAEHGPDRHLDPVRDTDEPDGRAGPGDLERGRHRLFGTDTLQYGVRTNAVGQFEYGVPRRVAAYGNDVRGTEFPRQLLPRFVPRQGN